MFSTSLLHSVSYFFFLYRSFSSSLCTVFDYISSNIDQIFLINPSANVFVFGDFNVHHKDWVTYSGEIERPGELCYNFSTSNDLTQMVNVPSGIPDCGFHSPALLGLFFPSYASIWSTVAFSVFIDFPSYNKMPHFIALLMAILVLMIIGSLCDDLREFRGRISLNSVLLMLLGNFVNGFRLELMYVSLMETIRSSLTHLHGFQLLVLLP